MKPKTPKMGLRWVLSSIWGYVYTYTHIYGWLSRWWSVFGSLIYYGTYYSGYPKKDPNFDNYPYVYCIHKWFVLIHTPLGSSPKQNTNCHPPQACEKPRLEQPLKLNPEFLKPGKDPQRLECENSYNSLYVPCEACKLSQAAFKKPFMRLLWWSCRVRFGGRL